MASSPPRRATASAADAADVSTPSPPQAADVILPHAFTEDGAGLHVLRKRGDTVEAGTVRPLREGQPLYGEVVSLRPREGTPLFDVEVLHDARPVTRGRPPKVATKSFRAGWDRIWGETDEPSARDEEPS